MKNRIMPAVTIIVLVTLAGGELLLRHMHSRTRQMQAGASQNPSVDSRGGAAAKLPADSLWQAPDDRMIPVGTDGELIRYGQDLIARTAVYFGPSGSISKRQNGMSCQNCHLRAGAQPWGNNFGGVASTYPKFKERRGTVESIAQRIADCFQRSLNGDPPDSSSREVHAMIAYMQWLGASVPKGKKPAGSGVANIPYLPRAADTSRGKRLYDAKCSRCHGPGGEGIKDNEAKYYIYPPLWGAHSYNTGASFYRLSRLAGFLRYNMPWGTDYRKMELSAEESWDLSAFINSQPRPAKDFPGDWPDISLKPVDHPFAPFPDSYPVVQHKYGPYPPIVQSHNAHKRPGLSKN